ncbi:MAG: HAD-IA family hydrolase [Hyphomicrobiales bacterium]
MSDIRAAIFDIGGVLTVSPVTRIKHFCAERGISDEIRTLIFAGHDGLWSRFERSELTPAEFATEFDRELERAGVTPCGPQFMEWFFQGFEPRPRMIAAVEHLRGRVKLGAITNNVAREEPATRRTAGLDISTLFDVVVESAIEGVRKPEPRIYEIACERLDVRPEEAVFLDDLGANLKGAKALGMTTIKVDETLSALGELERVLGIAFPRE